MTYIRVALITTGVLALFSVFFLFGERIGAFQSVAAVVQTQLASGTETTSSEEPSEVVFSNEAAAVLTSKEDVRAHDVGDIAINSGASDKRSQAVRIVEETFSETNEPQRTATYTFDTNTLTNDIHSLSNDARRDEQLPPLTFDAKLAQLAIERSTDMAKHNYLSHTAHNGCDLECRFVDAEYITLVWGENIGEFEPYRTISASTLAEKFVTMWLESSEHRRNLLSSSYTHHGVGVATAGNRMVVTVIFATPE